MRREGIWAAPYGGNGLIGTRPSSTERSRQLERRARAGGGDAAAARAAGSPTATTGVRLGGRDYVVRLSGQGHRRCSGSTATPSGSPPSARREPRHRAGARRGAARLPRDRVRQRARADRLSALRDEPEPVARALRAFHDSGLELPVALLGAAICSTTTRRSSTERGGALPDGYAPRAGAGRADRRGAAADASRSRATTTCSAATCSSTPTDAAARRLGVRRDGPPLLRPRQPGRQQRVRRATADERLLAAYFGEPADGGASAPRCALMRIVSDAREAAWGVVQGSISALDFDFAAYAQRALRRGCDAAADRPRLEEWLRCRDRVSCPTAPRRDHRRRRRRHLDRLPPGAARRARRGAARPQRADQRLDLPLRRASSASCAAASR